MTTQTCIVAHKGLEGRTESLSGFAHTREGVKCKQDVGGDLLGLESKAGRKHENKTEPAGKIKGEGISPEHPGIGRD